MRITRFIIHLSFSLIALLGFSHCTGNPFGDSGIAGKREIRGKVVLSPAASRKDIFVWLEGFNIGTRTDEGGNFQLLLPPPSSQSSGGVDGIFNLFFYLANYELATAEVVIQDGEFVFSKGDINQDGELSSPESLSQVLSIKTEIRQNDIIKELFAVIITLAAIQDSVTVVFPGSVGGLLGAVLLRNLDTGEIFIIEGTPGAMSRDVVLIGKMPITRSLFFSLKVNPLPRGTYEVIPYLLLRHLEIPTDLILSLGDDVEGLGPNYLKIPFRREQAIFEVE
ncbi:MAG: hypothetical protein ACE5HO_02680 [bacterium]